MLMMLSLDLFAHTKENFLESSDADAVLKIFQLCLSLIDFLEKTRKVLDILHR